MEKMFSFFY